MGTTQLVNPTLLKLRAPALKSLDKKTSELTLKDVAILERVSRTLTRFTHLNNALTDADREFIESFVIAADFRISLVR